ncbi:MAG: hypothetical protein JSU94_16515 [Phycisphaerales bacterium]|nr:MAG: hypothetical protein JSU94_16515 [Phycisphaerales bacterium]
MNRIVSFLGVAVIGFVVMAFAHFNYQEAEQGPWKDSVMYIGKGEPGPEAADIQHIRRPIRLLGVSGRAQAFMEIARSFGPDVQKAYRVAFEENVILYADMAADFTDQMLESGRLPLPGADEALAGCQAAHADMIRVAGSSFAVVGRLNKGAGVFANSYLIADAAGAAGLFDPEHRAVEHTYIIQLSESQLSSSQTAQKLKAAFPKSRFASYSGMIRTAKQPFCLYIAGMTLLLLGGSLFLAELYCTLSKRVRNRWLRTALAEVAQHKRLFVTMHLVYFGIVVLLMLFVYGQPELQTCLLMGAKAQVTGGSGPLGVAGKAYMSRSIPQAAVVTFAVNFLLGSLAVITLPSLIIPGVGVLVAGLRAVLWGLLLAPCFAGLSGMMLPHSVTLLLEGEGYVIATFFALLVPTYLCRKSDGVRLATRYKKGLLANLAGNLLVAIVLAVAAVYEAIEVISAMP